MNAQKYRPANFSDRRNLAQALDSALCGLGLQPRQGRGERVYTAPAGDRIELCVFSSVVWSNGHLAARPDSKDAIRVSLVYTCQEGGKRGLRSDTRINRTGTVQSILERVQQRTMAAFAAVDGLPRCHCGAPKFTSKAGNLVCAEACWTRKAPAPAPAAPQRPAPKPVAPAPAPVERKAPWQLPDVLLPLWRDATPEQREAMDRMAVASWHQMNN